MALQAALTGAPGPVPGPVLDAGPPPLPPTFSFGVPASPPGESTTSPHGLSGIPALSSPSPLRTAIEAPALPLSGHISQPIVPPVSSTTSPVYGVMSPPPVGIPPLPPSLPPVPSPTHEIAGVGDRAAAAPVGAEAGPSRPLPDPLLVNQHDAASRELGNMLLIDILRVSRLGLNRSVSKPCVRVHLISESTGRHIPR